MVCFVFTPAVDVFSSTFDVFASAFDVLASAFGGHLYNVFLYIIDRKIER